MAAKRQHNVKAVSRGLAVKRSTKQAAKSSVKRAKSKPVTGATQWDPVSRRTVRPANEKPYPDVPGPASDAYDTWLG